MKGLVYRKLIHTANALLLVFYFIAGRKPTVFLLLFLLLVALVVEFLRRRAGFGRYFDQYLGFMLKEEERKGITGATLLLVGDFVVFTFMPQKAVVPSILVASISDPLATFLGKIYGRIPLYMGKTLEGSMAFWVSSVIIMTLTLDHFWLSTGVALWATLLELFAGAYDNIIVPLGTGIMISLVPL